MTEYHFPASVFLATYEMPRHLEMVLEGFTRQTNKSFELFVCDDGSGPDTQAIVNKYQLNSPLNIQHIWQEQKGFRKSKLLNDAIRRSSGEVCIFIDGDCIPHPQFIEDHLILTEQGAYLAGRRVELGEKISSELTLESVKNGFFDGPSIQLLLSCLRGDSNHFQRSIRIQSPTLRERFGLHQVDDLKGCNFSVHREAINKINGFDEAYEGYGREDTDVELRLINLGYKIKSLKGLALQFHLWHARREFTPSNENLLNEVKTTGRFQCKKGLVYL